ncbi:unnamed protein product [Brachionus calyciflorus]|uniref:Uncharacterized protein n=1 Tax=Brachionus calyciflorus TaxID=104777 RepID=A0A813Y3R1_9BILA|nr:unnamed protein product [Brachionus calyciflorus]
MGILRTRDKTRVQQEFYEIHCQKESEDELSSKLDLFTRSVYWIILGVSQAETHMTNNEHYNTVKQQPLGLEIRKRQLSSLSTGCECPKMKLQEYTPYINHMSGRQTGKGDDYILT